MHIELIKDLSRLRKLRKKWMKLLSQSGANDFFLLPQWFFAWWSVFGDGKTLFFVAIWQNVRLCGLFPLVKSRKGPFRLLSFAGLPRAARMDFLLADDCRQEALVEFIRWLYQRNDWDLLSLRAFGPFSGNPVQLDQILADMGKKRTLTKENASYYIATGRYDSYDHFIANTRGAKTRKAFRRKKRKLIEVQNAQWKITHELNKGLIHEMAELDTNRSIRGSVGHSFFSKPKNRLFLEALARELSHENRVRTNCLRLGGRLYAFDLLFLYAGNALSYQTAFDRSFYAFSLGNLTLLESLQYTFARGFKTYDFLSGDNIYKQQWTKTFHQNWRLQIYRKGLRSYALFFYHRVVKPLRKRLRKIPAIEKLLPPKLKSRFDI